MTDKHEEDTENRTVKGKITVSPESLGKRIKGMFFSGEGSFVQYIIEDVIIPTAKELVITTIIQAGDGFRQAFEQKLFGHTRTPSRVGRRPGGPISYNSYSSPSASATRRREDTPAYHHVPRRSNVLQRIVMEDRDQAEDVIAMLHGVLERQGHCTVGDLYSLVDIRPVPTDEKWGWIDLSEAHTIAVRGGYYLKFPSPEAL